MILFSLYLIEVDANPTVNISFEEQSHIISSQDSFGQCEKIGDTLFTLSVPKGPKSYDITDKEQPVLLDGFQEEFYSHHFDIYDDLFFLADSLYGIKIYNITNPSNLQEIAQYFPEGDGHITGVCATETLLVANEFHASLGYVKILFINITDPTTPTKISAVSDGVSFFQRFYIENDLCYTTSYNNGLKIYNISNPEAVTEIYHYNELMSPLDFMKIGDIIYVGDLNYFRILNVSNLTSFTIIGEYYTTNDIMDIDVFNTIAVISERGTCLTALYISDPSNPQKIGQFDVIEMWCCDIDEQYLYLALDIYGIKILSYNLTTATSNLPIIVNIFEILSIYSIAILAKRIYLKFKNHC